MERFGEKLRILRQQRGLTLQELSQLLGVSTTHIWNIENGKKMPNVTMVIKVSDIFTVTSDQLIRDELEVG
ncbi:MAG: helix-turn-helix transcriptional regulator [Caldilineaceae bacterium]